ncbi:VOC family protein [Kribbella sp. NPDC023855]|uniref:VOC family protein n=1 Tax=Kribbella sp. NPDC023855 TaxID=3154698 RepID=UPI0033E74984
MKLESCTLLVRDLDEALDFYLTVLGFEVRRYADANPPWRAAVGPPSQPDLQIVLESPSADPVVPEADRETIEDLMTKGLLNRLVLLTDDCDEIFEHLATAGAEVMQEPIDRLDGVRDCAFLDPSGNLLRFVQPRLV